MEEANSLLDDFVAEAKEHLGSFEDDMLILEKSEGDDDAERINRLFRVVHSIKGGAGFLQLDRLKEISHVMETLLSMLRSGQIEPESRYVDALLAGSDLIMIMLDDIRESNSIDIAALHETQTS